jgi:hypothetical protein
MRHLDGVYTQRFNRTINRDGPLFRGRYKSILVDADTYLLQLNKYIHLNPVKEKIVKKPEDFLWSSYRAYINDEAPYWLNTQYTLSHFDNNSQKTKYKYFIEQNADKQLNVFYKKIKRTPILGTKKFIQIVKEKYLQEQHKVDDIPEHKLLTIRKSINIENIIETVTKFYRIDKEEINVIKNRSGNLPRKIVIYLASTIGQHSFPKISSAMCNITPSGVSRAFQRMEKEMQRDPGLKKDVELIREAMMNASIVQT